MISVAEALRLVLATVSRGKVETCEISAACGRVLGEDIIAPIPLPNFDNSAMDGYAIISSDTASACTDRSVSLRILGVIAAGDKPGQELHTGVVSGSAAQIFTGAMVPVGADAVVKQEDVVVSPDAITLTRPVKSGANIRCRGEEVAAGTRVMESGEIITPAGVGVLASLGIFQIPVIQKPRVGILVTGSELISVPGQLQGSSIYDSNSHVLKAALGQSGLSLSYDENCSDSRDELKQKLEAGLACTDFLLVTGGVSVGKFDYVKEVSSELGVGEVFWKVAQKPGKPLFVGKSAQNGNILFGLPGNPASVLVSYYEYVKPALMAAMGSAITAPAAITARLQKPFCKGAALTHFLKARYHVDGTVEVLEGQGSHMLSSFARANCLVLAEQGCTEYNKGDEVEIHLLDSCR